MFYINKHLNTAHIEIPVAVVLLHKFHCFHLIAMMEYPVTFWKCDEQTRKTLFNKLFFHCINV